ncbi:BTAD domain-containing putative transcriptional regulator [Kribbella sp. NPDC026611]|uniref:AfsR/SARP family transcriptional regulator n=1 Tax=Kribbella sp. NPDC026611 TaxID=3154911 RepID=UPI0033DF600D
MAGQQVDFRVLGALEFAVDGATVEIGSPKHRAMLAMLLVHTGRSVPIVELAEAIWGAGGPSDPRRAVQLYVTRLRAVFRDTAPTITIASLPSAYRLDVGADRVDLGRFHHLLDAARKAGKEGDADLESSLLAEALTEWRGAPLADVPSEFLQREVVPLLVEERVQALERYFDIELSSGRAAEVVGELSASAARYPLRERFAAQLMIALFRTGRRADALEVYHDVRQRLADELGVDPGDELQALHATVLAGRPAADDAAERAGSMPVPRQLPPDIAAFAGREDELTQLDRFRRETAGGVAIVAGMAGVGKTSLVVHWARRVADRFPDGQIWVNLRGYSAEPALRPETVLRRLLHALGVPDQEIPTELDDRAAMYRSLMDGRQALVVLDDARSPDQVRPLIPGSAGTYVVVTSRNQLTGLVASEGAVVVGLDLPSRRDAGRILADRVGRQRVAAEPAAADEIVDLCARLPLALAVSAARAVANPTFALSALAAELRRTRGSLDGFWSLDDPTEVRAVFSWSYNALSDGSARLFRLLGLHRGPELGVNAAASLAGVAAPDARLLLAELCAANLMVQPAPGRYAFHDLLRVYAVERTVAVDSPADRNQATRRLLDHYVGAALTATQLLRPCDPIRSRPVPAGVTVDDVTTAKQARAWWAAEQAGLFAAIRQATETELVEHAWLMSWAAGDFLCRQGHWRDWIAVTESALGLVVRHGSEADRAYGHRQLAKACARQGRAEDAWQQCRLALELAERNGGDGRELAITHRMVGSVLRAQRRGRDALEPESKARELFRKLGDPGGQARALNAIGWTYATLGDYDQALTNCQQALSLASNGPDTTGTAATWDTLGYVHHQLGDHRSAIRSYRRALPLFRELGDRYAESETLTRLGDTHRALGDDTAARTAWAAALDILADVRHRAANEVRTKLRELDSSAVRPARWRGRRRPDSAEVV